MRLAVWRSWRLAGEAFGVGVVGGGQDSGAPGLYDCGPAVVDVGGGVQAVNRHTAAILAVVRACMTRRGH
jgi:hypothetical protein